MAEKVQSPLEFVNLLKKSSTRLPFQTELASGGVADMLKDQFTLTTLLTLGGLGQLVLTLVLPLRLAMLPALFFSALKLLRMSLEASHVLPNSEMAGVVAGKVSAQLPSPTTGRFGSVPASQPLVVFMLGATVNHPLGMLAPGAAQLGDHFQQMMKALKTEAGADEYGVLAVSDWTGRDRPATNQTMTLFYFRDLAGLNKFAHSKLHRDGWAWYSRTNYPHIAIMHEAFCVPAGAYESIYVNMQPTMLGAASVPITDQLTGQKEWLRPLVAADKGVLRSQFGRITGAIDVATDKYVDAVGEKQFSDGH